MTMTTRNTTACMTTTLFDGFDERPVDMDFILPDYCPDIAAILKCRLKPMISSRQINGDRVLVDGTVTVQTMYLDEGRQCVRSVEFSNPFTASFTVTELRPDACLQISAKPDYVNCRATSPRRLDVHGAFSVKLKVLAPTALELLEQVEGEGVQTRQTTLACSSPAVSVDKSFTLSEVLELGNGKPPAEALIRGEALPVLTDCKLMMNKVVLKGCLYLRHLYAADVTTGKMEPVEHEIPFSQLVDVEGLQEDWLCDAQLDVAAGDVHISTNQNGEGALLSVSVKLNAHITCTRNEEATALLDVYSTRCPLHPDTRPVKAEQLCGILRTAEVLRETFDLPPEEIAGIVDLWGEIEILSTDCKEGKCRIAGRLNIYLLTRNNNGEISYFERPVDVEWEYADSCDRIEEEVCITRLDYVVNAQKQVELKVQLAVNRRCYRVCQLMAVCGVTADENDTFPPEKAALKIYYANAGESLWEIAKACHTSMDEVMKENELSSDILPANTMLLVPLC